MVGQTISHYRILQKLGEGGMGIIYKAEDLKLRRTVAVKLLPESFTQDEESKRRFINEAQAASSLQHNNICTIHEIDETKDGQLFIVMDCYEGESLKERISQGSLKLEEALDTAIQIANGLSKAHEKGIVHRDIKPANIFITDDGQVKIIDFGLAKLAGSTQLTKEGTTLGTVAYMSPEQTQGTNVDHRTDIWSLGVVLYEMVGGERPFKGDYDLGVIYSIMNEEPKSLEKVDHNFPDQLKKIILRCLAKKPGDRYQSIKDLLEDLKELAGIDSVLNINSFGRFFRGMRKVYILTGLVFLFLLFSLNIGGIKTWITGDSRSSVRSIRLAVLPFANLTGDSEQEYLSDGFTQEMISQLGRIHPENLSVIARSSVMRYKNSNIPIDQIGRELGVNYILEGSTRKDKENIRISADLIQVENQTRLWGNIYERKFSGILKLQSEVAQQVTEALALNLLPSQKASLTSAKNVNPQAYDAYLKGNFYWYNLTPQSLETALKYYELATELDPEYALGYAGIALVWMGRAQMGYEPYNLVSKKIMSAAEKALEFDSTLAEVHYTIAVINTWGEWDWEQSRNAFEKAIQINPNFAEARAYYSHLLFIINRPEEGIKQIEEALNLDPFNSLFRGLYAMALMYAKHYDDVIKMLEKIGRKDPYDPIALSTLKSAYHQKKMYQKALDIWRISFEVREDKEAINVLENGNEEGGYRVALQKLAELMVERSQTEYVTPWQIATIYARAGMNEEAIEWFEKAYEVHDPNMPYLNVDPIFDKLRDNPRFKILIKKMGLKN